ncbi:NAD-dependent epimerase/dehydratase family protein [Candidatus Gottesmanbacteria bacterium]|nr:NAD-dependent epimerase/dehydratase family protein [Candidatus Gottesmanbacteria bacterium]
MLKNILITGGAGYVGAVLVPKLLTAGYKVKVLDLFLYGENVFEGCKNNPNLRRIKGDIRDQKLLERELKNVDCVIHLACISNDPSFELDPILGRSVNYDSTLKLVDAAKHMKVKRFIYVSTSSVYGVKKEKEVNEDLSLEPLTDYSKYKAMCEEYLLKKQTGDFTVLILRPATICGYSPRLRLDLTVNMLTLQALVNNRITVYGGKQYRPNIHIEDITDLYVKVLAMPSKKIAGKIYNAGSENLTVLEIAQKIKKVLGRNKIKITVTDTNDNRSYRIASSKIKKELGFIPMHTVDEAILDLKKAYDGGNIPDPLREIRYYNVRMMKEMMTR